MVTFLLPHLVDVVHLGDSEAEHFGITVLVQSKSIIIEVPTEGVAEREVQVDGTPSDAVDDPPSDYRVEGLIIDTAGLSLRMVCRETSIVVALSIQLILVVLSLTRLGVYPCIFGHVVHIVGIADLVDPVTADLLSLYSVIAK